MMIGLANVARRVAKQHEAITVNEDVAPLARWRKSWGLESYSSRVVSPAFSALRCVFDKQTTRRGYETGTSDWALAGTRGQGRHDAKGRFAGKT